MKEPEQVISKRLVREALNEIEHYIIGVQMTKAEWQEFKKVRLGL